MEENKKKRTGRYPKYNKRTRGPGSDSEVVIP